MPLMGTGSLTCSMGGSNHNYNKKKMKTKRNHMKIIVLALLCFTGGWTHAQQTRYTLKDCIETGIKNNLEVMQSGLDAEVARANWQQSKAMLYPDLNGYVT